MSIREWSPMSASTNSVATLPAMFGSSQPAHAASESHGTMNDAAATSASHQRSRSPRRPSVMKSIRNGEANATASWTNPMADASRPESSHVS